MMIGESESFGGHHLLLLLLLLVGEVGAVDAVLLEGAYADPLG